MPAIKKYENLDVGDSIYSASRLISKRELKNMIPPQQQLDMSGDFQNRITSNLANTQQQIPIRGKSTFDREDLVSKLILNLNNINGLFTSLYLVGDDFHQEDMFGEEDNFDRHYQGRGFSGGMEVQRKKRGPAPKSIEQKIQEIEKLKRDAENIREQIKLMSTTKGRNTTAKNTLEREEKRIQRLILSKNKSITKKQQEEYEQNNPVIAEQKHQPVPISPVKLKFNTDKYDEREDDVRQLYFEIEHLEKDELRNLATDSLLQSINLLTYLIGDGDYIRLSEDGTLEEATPQEKAAAIAFGEAQISILQPKFLEDYPDLTFDDNHIVLGNHDTPYKPQVNQIDYIRTGKSTILVILKQIQTLIKQSEQYIKRIISNKIVASESDLNMIAEEITDMMELKARFPLPIDEENFHSPEIAAYLTKIIMQLLDPLIGNLKTYLKINAQLNYKQLQGIRGSSPERLERGEVPVEGSGRLGVPTPNAGSKGQSLLPQSLGRNLILSDTVRRIHNYDKKYLL